MSLFLASVRALASNLACKSLSAPHQKSPTEHVALSVYQFKRLETLLDRLDHLQDLKEQLRWANSEINRRIRDLTEAQMSDSQEFPILTRSKIQIGYRLKEIDSEIIQVCERSTSLLPTFELKDIKHGYIYRGTLLRRLSLRALGGNEFDVLNMAVTQLDFGDLASFTNPLGWHGQGPKVALNYANGSADPTPDRVDKIIIEVPLKKVESAIRFINNGDHLALPGTALQGLRGVRIYRVP